MTMMEGSITLMVAFKSLDGVGARARVSNVVPLFPSSVQSQKYLPATYISIISSTLDDDKNCTRYVYEYKNKKKKKTDHSTERKNTEIKTK